MIALLDLPWRKGYIIGVPDAGHRGGLTMSNHDICVSMLNDFTEAQLANVAVILRAMKQIISDIEVAQRQKEDEEVIP